MYTLMFAWNSSVLILYCDIKLILVKLLGKGGSCSDGSSDRNTVVALAQLYPARRNGCGWYNIIRTSEKCMHVPTRKYSGWRTLCSSSVVS